MSSGSTQEISLRSFQYEELEQATNGFMEEVGRGAFGTVFKAQAPTNSGLNQFIVLYGNCSCILQLFKDPML
ncbi:hypothetical protein Syun_021444 [Stephania yunnanensis]|uniref:Protein kinase domain-containing protein n=1 Tax=Stephania yunnanensis TaxID=152371 RepID=A0AAP0IHL4_9MAGN